MIINTQIGNRTGIDRERGDVGHPTPWGYQDWKWNHAHDPAANINSESVQIKKGVRQYTHAMFSVRDFAADLN